MTIVRVGATKKYSDGWDAAFGKGKKKAQPATASKKKASPKKKTTAKKSAKKKAAKKQPAAKSKRK